MIAEFKGVLPGQEIFFTTQEELYSEPDCALIFAFYNRQIIFTHHKKRGWELPGGKREKNECIIQAALRELLEETGAEAKGIETIAQYKICEFNELVFTKNIFIADISRIHERKEIYETDKIMLMKIPPEPTEIMNDRSYSLLLKDKVYELALSICQNHRFLNKK
ncbi:MULTISPECIES: NUDIX domain-containing protein [Paenibacillus]|uniref:Nudix hydrolase domain-containing protein n=1 Tax=Paenibacillus aceti TaxID=1820010 RepID=A0ABQ1W9Z0_9BACL|nr:MULTISPECIES: NUDIX domain-containing protein [Paenibacillus]GGG20243.1 hypothetical protein GCM10010913_48050 [Paenibacillus aceti]